MTAGKEGVSSFHQGSRFPTLADLIVCFSSTYRDAAGNRQFAKKPPSSVPAVWNLKECDEETAAAAANPRLSALAAHPISTVLSFSECIQVNFDTESRLSSLYFQIISSPHAPNEPVLKLEVERKTFARLFFCLRSSELQPDGVNANSW